MGGRNYCKCVTVSLVPTASLTLVILFACGIVLLPILYVELSHEYKYGIVIDAGSSHTTLYGYRWRVPTKNNSTGVIDVKEIYQCTKQKSLNSFASRPNEAYKAIQHCLTGSKKYKNLQIDETVRQYMPIYLGATAGMRVLNMRNRTASDAILTTVRATLKNSSYQYENARIISGEEEAIGGWTTANYLDKNLNPPKETTVGSLDLGGASSQIAFQVFDDSPGYKPSEKLFNQKYNLFARSYLCYGINEAHRRFLASLVDSAVKKGVNVSITSVSNPCLATGTNVTYHHSEIYTGCAHSPAAMEAFGFGYAPPTSLAAENDVNFKGAWNAEECQANITKIFNFSQCWPEGNCPGNNFTIPPVNGSFTAFSTFYYTTRYFAPSNTTIKKNDGWGDIRSAVAKNCSMTRNSTSDSCIVNGKVKRSCYQNCFNGPFMLYLLENGFGFNNQSTTNNWTVEFQEKVNGVSVGWALGYMLEQTSHIRQDKFMELRPYTAVDLVVGILILTILCVVFFIFFFLTFYACRKALRPRNGFQPL